MFSRGKAPRRVCHRGGIDRLKRDLRGSGGGVSRSPLGPDQVRLRTGMDGRTRITGVRRQRLERSMVLLLSVIRDGG